MSGWAAVKADLLAYLPTLPGLTDPDAVSDGASLAQTDRETYAEVGGADAGFFQQDTDPIDTFIAETGEVNVRLVARSGDTALAALQTTVEAWLTALRQRYKADQTLAGTLTPGSTIYLGRVDVSQEQTDRGGLVVNTAAIRYTTRL